MARFEMGYPELTGDAETDIANLYDFACEMVDRLSYAFRATEKANNRAALRQEENEE